MDFGRIWGGFWFLGKFKQDFYDIFCIFIENRDFVKNSVFPRKKQYFSGFKLFKITKKSNKNQCKCWKGRQKRQTCCKSGSGRVLGCVWAGFGRGLGFQVGAKLSQVGPKIEILASSGCSWAPFGHILVPKSCQHGRQGYPKEAPRVDIWRIFGGF